MRAVTIDVSVLSDPAALRALEAEWRVLADDGAGGGFFRGPDWLLPWWHAYHQMLGARPHVLVARDEQAFHYRFPVEKGATHAWKSLGGALTGDDTVAAESVDAVGWVDGKSPLAAPLDHLGRKPTADASPWLRRLVIGGAVLAGVVLVGAIVTVATRRRSPPRAPPPAPRPMPLAPPAPPMAYAPTLAYGPVVPERRVAPTLDDLPVVPAECPRCRHHIPPGYTECTACGLPLV